MTLCHQTALFEGANMLPTLDDLRDALEKKFCHSEFDLSDLLLVSPGVSCDVVRASELALGERFPDEFSELVKLFDFSRLSLCGLIFQYGIDLERFVQTNLGEPMPWWGTGSRPLRLLLVGTTDGHCILLSSDTGKVEALPKDGRDLQERVLIADNFEILIRAAGAISLGCSTRDRLRTARDFSAIAFWEQLASGAA